MIERLQNQVDEIELWDVELEDMPNLEASDIPGVYFNEFREYVDKEGIYCPHQRSIDYGIKVTTRTIIIDRNN